MDDDREIRTTRKLDDLMLNYYLNDSRVGEINRLFEGAPGLMPRINRIRIINFSYNNDSRHIP